MPRQAARHHAPADELGAASNAPRYVLAARHADGLAVLDERAGARVVVGQVQPGGDAPIAPRDELAGAAGTVTSSVSFAFTSTRPASGRLGRNASPAP
jgi:hypothetical protein